MLRTVILITTALVFAAGTPAPAQDAPAPGLDQLIKAFHDAGRDKDKRRAAVTALFERGEPAFERAEALASEAEASAGKARAAADEGGTPELARARREAEAAARAAGKLRDALYMEVVVGAFRRIEKKHGNLNLVYAGQFSDLKKEGRRAVRGALLLMKDLDLHQDEYHRKAWEVLADLGDKSVIPELKEISNDFLMEDEIQLGAVYAMAALGDLSGIEAKIRECQQRMADDPNERVPMSQRMATIYYHGRQYRQAVSIYETLIQAFERELKERGSEMPAQRVDAFRGGIASWAYNCACNQSLDEKPAAAYAMLARSLRFEPDRATYLENILRDGDLVNLRADKGFKAWYEKAKQGQILDAPPGEGGVGGENPDVRQPEENKPGETGSETPPKSGGGESPAPETPEKKPAGEKKPVSAADLDAAEGLVTEYLAAAGEARGALVTKLAALGEAAFRTLEARLEADPKNLGLKSLYEKLCAELVLATFRKVEAVDPEGTLTFAGQFDSLRVQGKRAVLGAMTVLKDDHAKMQYRTWAGDALGDLGDKSVIEELREIADDFLRDDVIQETAAFAMAALGDSSALDKKIEAIREAENSRSLGTQLRIAHMLYRGRRYDDGLKIYQQAVDIYTEALKTKGGEMDAKQKAGMKNDLASFYYSIACNHSLLGQIDEAFQALDRSVENDLDRRFIRSITRDGDLRKLRADPRYAGWYEKVKEKVAAAEKAKAEAEKAAKEKAEEEKPGKAKAEAEKAAKEKAEEEKPGKESPPKSSGEPGKEPPEKTGTTEPGKAGG